MKSNTTTILIAVGALLFGGVATAAYMNSRGTPADAVAAAPVETASLQASATDTALDDAAPLDNQIEPAALQYAQVTKVAPITNKDKVYATVIGSEPVRETTTTSVPHEVCEDVVVEERLPERDGNTGGTVAGAVIGGLLGNQVGNGNGKKAATAAGAVAGGRWRLHLRDLVLPSLVSTGTVVITTDHPLRPKLRIPVWAAVTP